MLILALQSITVTVIVYYHDGIAIGASQPIKADFLAEKADFEFIIRSTERKAERERGGGERERERRALKIPKSNVAFRKDPSKLAQKKIKTQHINQLNGNLISG